MMVLPKGHAHSKTEVVELFSLLEHVFENIKSGRQSIIDQDKYNILLKVEENLRFTLTI